jgi:Uma2 family endonuclease
VCHVPSGRRPEKRYTVEEFEALPDTKGVELLDGALVEKPVGNAADVVTGNLFLLLGPFVRQHRLGTVHGPEAGYVLVPGRVERVRKPDLSVVARGRYPEDGPPQGYARLAPDFAFESVSPKDYANAVQEKVEEYLRAGVRLVWVAYPPARVVLAFRPDGSAQRFAAADELKADDLFPGFACRTADLFEVG